MTDDCAITHHRISRTKLYVPDEVTFPIPLKYIDVLRRTTTDIDSEAEHIIEDIWIDDGEKELSGPWFGKTVFYILRPPAPSGYEWAKVV